jgi:hypothetical protein
MGVIIRGRELLAFEMLWRVYKLQPGNQGSLCSRLSFANPGDLPYIADESVYRVDQA